MHINYISYDMPNDTFEVVLDNDATMSIACNGPDDCVIHLKASDKTIEASAYFNVTCLIADVLRAIVDAQEREGAELPCDLEMPLKVPNTFSLLTTRA